MSPRVSVLLTSYAKAQMLDEAIASVLAQTFQDFELIVLDDNSPDPVSRVLTKVWNYPKVSIYKSDISDEDRPKTTRYATLANVGLQLARGEYVTYLCDDDLYVPHRLERMVARLDQGDCQVVYGSQTLIDEDGRTVGQRRADRILEDAAGLVDHSSVMHTLEAGLEVGGWDDDPRLWRQADAAFWRRLTSAGHHFHPIPEVLDLHRFHAESVSGRLDRGLGPCG